MIAKLQQKLKAALVICSIGLPGVTAAASYEIRQGFDVFTQSQSAMTSFHSLSLMHEFRPGLFFGQSLYSAAGGDGGGLFVGGFEIMKRLPLNDRVSLEFSAFIGGGGGANVVKGDGLMTRVSAAIARRFSNGMTGYVGASFIDITGSPISTPALTFGFSNPLSYSLSPGHVGEAARQDGTFVAAFKPLVRTYVPINSTGRDGRPVDQMFLLGADVAFVNPDRRGREVFLRAAGAVAGDGEGYAEWLLGYRWTTQGQRYRAFAELGAGFAGGGAVDTGGGLVVAAGLGISAHLFGGVNAEFGANAITALSGDFRAIGGFGRVALRFGAGQTDGQTAGQRAGQRAGAPNAPPRRWQMSLGMAAQVEHAGYRRPGSGKSGSPILAETSVDLFLTDHIYLTGNAQTVMLGDAGGYAVGLFGLGYEFGLNPKWTLSGEVYIGAAAGGGIDTGGGLIAGGKFEVDYTLSPGLKVSAGVGKMFSRGGANPVTAHFGVKMPFTTFH